MFDIGSFELLLIFIVALLIIGPQRLPELAYMLGSLFAKIRNLILRLKQETEVDKHIQNFRKQTGLDDYIDSESLNTTTTTFNKEINEAKHTLMGTTKTEQTDSKNESQ